MSGVITLSLLNGGVSVCRVDAELFSLTGVLISERLYVGHKRAQLTVRFRKGSPRPQANIKCGGPPSSGHARERAPLERVRDEGFDPRPEGATNRKRSLIRASRDPRETLLRVTRSRERRRFKSRAYVDVSS